MQSSKLKLFRVWVRISLLAAESQLLTDWSGILFLVGKVVRFVLYFIFLFSILSGVRELAGFSREQVIFFFLIFSLIDALTQFLFRGVYLFRSSVVDGGLDMDLLKPWPSFFRPIFGWTDILDFITLVPLFFYILYFSFSNNLVINSFSWVLFLILILNSLLISFSFHLIVCAICILTLEIDHLVMIYRDLTAMGRFPTDIYPKAIQTILTFTIPVVLIFTIPAKALLGILSWNVVVISLLVGIISITASLWFWRYALRRYSSASS